MTLSPTPHEDATSFSKRVVTERFGSSRVTTAERMFCNLAEEIIRDAVRERDAQWTRTPAPEGETRHA